MKVKFTKLAALLLAGVALFATGCTDYEVDIQKVDKKVDNLTTEVNNKIASLDQQIAGINATIATLETKAAHDADIQSLRTALETLEGALRAALDGKVDKDVYNAKIQELDALDELFKGQIADLYGKLDTTNQAITDLETALKGQIAALELRVKNNEDAITELTKEGGVIDQLKARVKTLEDAKIKMEQDIQNLQDGKLDKATFEQYKTETAGTIADMKKAIGELAKLNTTNKTSLVDAINEVVAKFDDYVLKTTFEEFVKIAATKEELALVRSELLGRIEDCEELLNTITNDEKTGRLDVLEKAEADLEKLVKETILPQIQFAIDYKGTYGNGLQGYIDDGDAWALEEAKKYTDSQIKLVMETVYDLYYELYDVIQQLATRIQSIVYVPDYDDLKITSNMAKTTVPGVEGALYIDQPTAITYKILPAKYAAAVADNFEKLLVFDVKTVNTRADEGEVSHQPEFQITAAEKDANIDENGLVTFTVLPVNVASAAFAATAIPVAFEAVLDDEERVYPVVKEADLEAYLAREAFAASLRFMTPDVVVPVGDHRDGDVEYSQEYNEVASTYNVLYPGISHIVDVPGNSFKKLDDGSIREFTEDERHLKLPYNSDETRIILDQAVAGYVVDGDLMSYEQATEAGIVVPKYDIQFPGDVLYVNVNGNQKEKNYTVDTESYVEVGMNLDEPASARMFEIDNQVAATYTFSSELGSFTDEGDVTITKELGEVTVSAEAIWTWDWNKDGKVVDEEGAPVQLGDALIDHNIFYEAGEPTNYVRMSWPVVIDEKTAGKLEEDLGITLENFEGVGPKTADDQKEYLASLKIRVADRLDEEGEEIADEDLEFEDLAADATFAIENVAIKDDALFADFNNFEWDKVYEITAVYELEYATITVNGTFKTFDRYREMVSLPLKEYTFDINKFDEETGFGYIAGAKDEESGTTAAGYYYWKSEPMHKEIFELFNEKHVINVLSNVDFEYDGDQDDFNESELNTHIRAYNDEPGPGTAFKYVDINRNGIYAETKSADAEISAKSLKEINTGKLSEDPNEPYMYEGNVITRYITTYIGEVVEIPFKFNYRVPAYDFLHQVNYTFPDEEKWYTMASPKYDVNKNSLQKYDVEYMNIPALSFNVIDDQNRYLYYKDEPLAEDEADKFFTDENLIINFFYTDKAMYETPIEDQSMVEGKFEKYGDLWFTPSTAPEGAVAANAPQFDTTVFYYRSTRDAIAMQGKLEVVCDDVRFEIPTSFKGNHYLAGYDYSQFELRAWTPFYVPTYTQTIYIDLDEHITYQAHVLEGLQFFDGRQVAASTPVDEIKTPFVEGTYSINEFNSGVKSYFRPMLGFNADEQTGEEVWGWIKGDEESTNGYYPGTTSWEAYDLQVKDFKLDDRSGVPADLKAMLTVEKLSDFDHLVKVDYTSETEFKGTAEVDFSYQFQTPWQVFDNPFTVKVIIRGLDSH